MKKATREWVRKAEADYQRAVVIARRRAPFHDKRCFHCQQSAEKYLKALLEELALAVPKIHELERLLSVLEPHYPALRLHRQGLALLTNFAISGRRRGDRTPEERGGRAEPAGNLECPRVPRALRQQLSAEEIAVVIHALTELVGHQPPGTAT